MFKSTTHSEFIFVGQEIRVETLAFPYEHLIVPRLVFESTNLPALHWYVIKNQLTIFTWVSVDFFLFFDLFCSLAL